MQKVLEQTTPASRHHSNHKTWYTIDSATEQDCYYTVTFRGKLPICNCRNGRENNDPMGCHHKRTALFLEHQYQMAKHQEMAQAAIEAAQAELQAFKKWGFKAYEKEPFSLMR